MKDHPGLTNPTKRRKKTRKWARGDCSWGEGQTPPDSDNAQELAPDIGMFFHVCGFSKGGVDQKASLRRKSDKTWKIQSSVDHRFLNAVQKGIP